MISFLFAAVTGFPQSRDRYTWPQLNR
jgi:hypothetical protein